MKIKIKKRIPIVIEKKIEISLGRERDLKKYKETKIKIKTKL